LHYKLKLRHLTGAAHWLEGAFNVE